jgi:hypothetical protein
MGASVKTIRFLTMLCAVLGVAPLHGAESPSVTVRWLMQASAEVEAEKGVVTVPVVDPAGDCISKFQVLGISSWVVQQKGANDVVDVRSEMSVSVRKLFEGKSPIPELTVIQSIDDLDLPSVISFRGKPALEKDSWNVANAEFTEQFDGGAVAVPSTWKRIELRCSK